MPRLGEASPLRPEDCVVVLVRANDPRNVAAACRAMKNMGLSSLRLVEPPVGLGGREVRSLAYRAWDVLDSASLAPSLQDSVADCGLVVGTSGRKGRGEMTPRLLALEGGKRSRGGKVALVFGPEATGLTRQELRLCHVRVRIPSAPAQPSLNLAQAVLILGYEIFFSREGRKAPSEEPRATAGELEGVLSDLRRALLEIGFLNAQNPDALLAEIRGLLSRARLTPREVLILKGMARQIAWAGGIARKAVGLDNGESRF